MRRVSIFLLWSFVIVKTLGRATYNIYISTHFPQSTKVNVNVYYDGKYVSTNAKYFVNRGSPMGTTTNITDGESTGKKNVDEKFARIENAGKLSGDKCKEYYPDLPPDPPAIYYVGAQPSLAREYPHMALIGLEGTDAIDWICGGSLISHHFVLTAAHCLKSRKLVVRLGDLDTANDTDEAEPQDFNATRIILHPGYKISSHYHDVGLIELDRKVKRTEFVGMACLDTRRQHFQTKMTITGWGRTDLYEDPSSHLLKSTVDVVPHNTCKMSYRKDSALSHGIMDDAQICARGPNGEDACKGDSGGPLQVFNRVRSRNSENNVYDIVGITSFGKACGISPAPGVYTRVYNYLSWIEGIVWP